MQLFSAVATILKRTFRFFCFKKYKTLKSCSYISDILKRPQKFETMNLPLDLTFTK